MSKIYGAASPGAFCAELVGVMCSGDMERVKAFNGRLIARTGEQLTLQLNAAMDAATGRPRKAKEGQRRKKTAKGAPKRGKRT